MRVEAALSQTAVPAWRSGGARRPRSGRASAGPRPETSTSRSTISATASTDRPRASHWRGSLTSTACSTWSWLRTEVDDSSVTLFDEELEDVLVLAEGEVAAARSSPRAVAGWRRARASRRRRRRARARSVAASSAMRRKDARVTYSSMPSVTQLFEQATRRGSPLGTTAPGHRTAARCSCRRWRGCRRRCAASGRCSRSPATAAGLRMIALSCSSTSREASSSASRARGAGRACQRGQAPARTAAGSSVQLRGARPTAAPMSSADSEYLRASSWWVRMSEGDAAPGHAGRRALIDAVPAAVDSPSRCREPLRRQRR